MAYFEINGLVVKHKSYEGIKTVLDIDHLEIQKGETFGLVGESGQGKTVLALAIQQLLPHCGDLRHGQVTAVRIVRTVRRGDFCRTAQSDDRRHIFSA